MDENKLHSLAVKCLMTMACVCLLTLCFTYGSQTQLYASTGIDNRDLLTEHGQSVLSYEQLRAERDGMTEKIYTDLATGKVVNDLGDKYLIVPKEKGSVMNVSLEDLYIQKKVRLIISGLEGKSYLKQDLKHSDGGQESLQKISLTYTYDPGTFQYSAVFELQMDQVYAYRLYESSQNIYLRLQDVHEVYEHIVVVDAGHGGDDTGTYSSDLKCFEKDINLSVALYLKDLLDKNKEIKVYYTRLVDEKVYLNPRLDLANGLKADLFVSIHCNASNYESAKGTEVLYRSGSSEKNGLTSKDFAEICRNHVVDALSTRDRGLLNGNDIYIIENAEMPIALIEMGFMSNSEDMGMLYDTSKRKIAAEAIYDSIKEAIGKKRAAGG